MPSHTSSRFLFFFLLPFSSFSTVIRCHSFTSPNFYYILFFIAFFFISISSSHFFPYCVYAFLQTTCLWVVYIARVSSSVSSALKLSTFTESFLMYNHTRSSQTLSTDELFLEALISTLTNNLYQVLAGSHIM